MFEKTTIMIDKREITKTTKVKICFIRRKMGYSRKILRKKLQLILFLQQNFEKKIAIPPKLDCNPQTIPFPQIWSITATLLRKILLLKGNILDMSQFGFFFYLILLLQCLKCINTFFIYSAVIFDRV